MRLPRRCSLTHHGMFLSAFSNRFLCSASACCTVSNQLAASCEQRAVKRRGKSRVGRGNIIRIEWGQSTSSALQATLWHTLSIN